MNDHTKNKPAAPDTPAPADIPAQKTPTAQPAAPAQPAPAPAPQNAAVGPPPAQGAAGSPAPQYVSAVVPPAPSVPPFQAGVKDGVFALAAFILGYLFCRWVLTSVAGWGTAVFTAVFLASVTAYLQVKGIKPAPASWFWFGITLLTGVSFALWNDNGLILLRSLFLFAAAVYWVLSATAVQLAGRTSNYLLLDGLNGVFIIPFRNFVNQYRSLGVLKRKKTDGKKALPVILGIVLAVIALFVVVPQLLRADSGGFSRLMKSVVDLFRFDWSGVLEFLLYCLLAVPTAAYIFGLVSGSAAKRATDTFKPDKTEKTVTALRILPSVTVFTVLGTVCALYIVFIVCQLPYFFSAFSGATPEGWLSYSEYARQGFFELCRLSVINLLLIAASNIMSKKPRTENAVLKAFNIALALITLLLIATAFSKMALYIDVFGLTIPRILPCVFMVFLAVVCAAVIALQKTRFSIARVALVTGAVLFAALCLVDADALVVRYNTGRYLAGTLSDYDTSILYRSGPAGVAHAAQVYTTTEDETLKGELREYLAITGQKAKSVQGTYRDTVQCARVRQTLDRLCIEIPPPDCP
jgi:hypothetical protein